MRSPWRREAHKIAEERGIVHVDRMLQSLTAKQFAELLAYKRLEPFKEFRADVRAAQIVAMIHNMAVAKKHRKEVKDFLIKFTDGQPKRRQTQAEQFNLMRILAMAYNAPGVNE